MSELKPCPFCGYEAECYESRGELLKIYKISCSNGMCEARPVIKVAGLNEATEAWNTRSLTTKQQCADEMYDLLDTIENDDGKIPEWLWDRIQAVKKKARGEA